MCDLTDTEINEKIISLEQELTELESNKEFQEWMIADKTGYIRGEPLTESQAIFIDREIQVYNDLNKWLTRLYRERERRKNSRENGCGL